VITAVHVPEDLQDAVSASRRGAMILSGGTVVMPDVNTSVHQQLELVSLRRVGLDGIALDGGRVTIGAATTLTQLLASDEVAFLHDAVRSIASPTIRNMATVGGNLFAHQPYGDLAACLLALDAEASVTGASGERSLSVGQVIKGAIDPGDIVTSVAFDLPEDGEWFYRKAMRRKLNSASLVTVAAVIRVADGTVSEARIALGGVDSRPVRASSAEQALTGQPFARDAVEAAAVAARDDVSVFTDAYASAWYRERVLPVHIRRALLGE
jgi:VCBS repeat-containing protein